MAAPSGIGTSGTPGVLGGLLSSPGALVATAGLLVGVLGAGSLAAAGLIGPGAGGGSAGADADRTLAVYTCYENGQLLGRMPPGQEVLVTALNADGTWLQIQFPGPAVQRAWVQAPPFTVEGNLAALPKAACDETPAGSPVPATFAPSTAPSPSPAPEPTIEPGPSTEPFASAAVLPSATPSPSPSEGPSSKPNAAPIIGGLRESRSTIYADPGGYCPTNAKRVTISAPVTDADGIASATLWFRKPGVASYTARPMTRAPGSSTWSATIGSDSDGISVAGTIPYYVVARDSNASPKSTRRPSPGIGSVAVGLCQNTGPTVTSLASNQATVYWVPVAGVGCAPTSPTSTTITAALTDVEGVASAKLFYTTPGGSSYRTKTMARRGSSWVASLSTSPNANEIAGRGTVKYYVIGTDVKGKAGSATPVKSFKAVRCDTEAALSISSYPTAPTTLFSCQFPYAYFYATASDVEGLATTSARIYYRIPGWPTYRSRPMGQSDTSGPRHYYGITMIPSAWKTGTFSWYVITTDLEGGTTRSPVQSFRITHC